MEIAGRKVPTIFLVKPDKVRYWTRSMALRDADEVAADIILWQKQFHSIPTPANRKIVGINLKEREKV